jgi:hypothetical protein
VHPAAGADIRLAEGAADNYSAGAAVDSHPAGAEAGSRRAEEEVDSPPVVPVGGSRPVPVGGIHPVPAVGSRRQAEGEVVDCSSNLPDLSFSRLQGYGDRGDDLIHERLSLDIPKREQDSDEPNDSAETRENQINELADH